MVMSQKLYNTQTFPYHLCLLGHCPVWPWILAFRNIPSQTTQVAELHAIS